MSCGCVEHWSRQKCVVICRGTFFSDCHVGTSIAEKSLETAFSLFKLALPKETVNDPEGWNCRGYPYVYHKNG
jgi:hypothetical protein